MSEVRTHDVIILGGGITRCALAAIRSRKGSMCWCSKPGSTPLRHRGVVGPRDVRGHAGLPGHGS
jgi:hypothetical protein